MSEAAEEVAARPIAGAKAYLVLAGLVAGLLGGMLVDRVGGGTREPLVQASSVIGSLWLNALKMTVVPLIVALLVTGIARTAEAARGGRIAVASMIAFGVIYILSGATGAFLTPLLTSVFPLPQSAAEAMRAGLASVDPSAAAGAVPKAGDFVRNIIPSNVIGAAANGDILPLVVFTLLFAIAVSRLASQPRRTTVALFEAISDALLIVIGWVLWLAPLGVLALSFDLGASAGSAAFAALAYYVALVSAIGIAVTILGYFVAVFAGRVNPVAFTTAILAPQSLAVSSRSSLACLPAMLAAARILKVRDDVADVTLPMAVALFRATSPAMNLAVLFYVAEWLGLEPSIAQVLAAVFVALLMALSAVSLPGEISFISSIAPIGIALGIPLAPLALLVAVEMVPDIFRTLGNVTLDMAVTTVVDRSTETSSETQRD